MNPLAVVVGPRYFGHCYSDRRSAASQFAPKTTFGADDAFDSCVTINDMTKDKMNHYTRPAYKAQNYSYSSSFSRFSCLVVIQTLDFVLSL